MRKKLIVKLGSSTLTAGTDRISYAKIEDIARQILKLQEDYEIVLVSSGAIAAARQFVDIAGHTREVDSKQAMSAIGQPKLMRIYDEVFGSLGLEVAQCLMTYRDFESESAKDNTKNTINKLLANGYTPIVNENDTVGIEELVLGDNDKLSALVACITDAKLLVLASDMDGLFSKNPHAYPNAEHVPIVTDLSQVESFIEDRDSELGTGGMTSKIQAARICAEAKIEMWIVNGGRNNFLVDVLRGAIPCTQFRA